MDKDKPLTPFEKFAARRIAEFPTLYSCADDVIARSILSPMGDCSWESGVLKQPNQHYNSKSEKYTQYPLQIPLAAARDMLNKTKWPSFSFETGGGRAPISNIPKDIDKSYLEAISHFLWKWGRYTLEQWQLVARVKCLMYYQTENNPHAGQPQRDIDDYERFMSFVPKWEAAIREIEYFQRHGEVDARTFQGADI